MKWTRHVTRMDENCLQNFSQKTEGMRPLGRSRRRWGDIRMNLG